MDKTNENPVTVEAASQTNSEKAVKPPKHFRISYERRKSLYGYGFIAIWLIGAIYFFVMPVITSFIYSFNDTQVVAGVGKMTLTWNKFGNYIFAFREDPTYVTNLVAVLQQSLLKTPLIIVFSIFIAMILNQKFKGRTAVRAIFFLPVIIATGLVINIINNNLGEGGFSGAEQFTTMFEADLVDQLLTFIGIYGLSPSITTAITTLTSDVFNLVWNSGIQILIFLAALQSIPSSAKEASDIEGATSWEFFWKITLPYISPMILANLIYTIIDTFTDPGNTVMIQITTLTRDWQYGKASAMTWAYFMIVLVAVGIVFGLVKKFIHYEVD